MCSHPEDSGDHQPLVMGCRYRLSLTADQQQRLERWSGALRALWNAALEQRQMAWRHRRMSVGLTEQCRDLTEARRDIPWLRDVPAQVAQQTLRDLDRAFGRFFKRLAGYPRFRTRRRDPGLRFPQGVEVRRINRRWGEVRLAKLGWVRFRWTRPPGDRVRHASLTRDALGWHVALCVEIHREPAQPNGGPGVGVDRGVVALVATSNGELVDGNFWTPSERRRRQALEKRLVRQCKGSRARQRTVDQVARLWARVARRRKNALHVLSRQLAGNHGMVGIEDLHVRAMTRSARGTVDQPGRNIRAKAALNREILERGWGEFHRQLGYKCVWYGSRLIAVPPHQTSQTCSACQAVDPRSRESQASFRCRACGHAQQADINAARVILGRALKLTAGGPSVAARGGLAVGRPGKREPTLREIA